ncbi:hypothetical protein G7085_16325 [Tessaracoccus sp. HDW20]|uniref:DUF5979 domain-containing protein n=1 Tax=Tessaracoccus coleopterorum TaxID=2714950 RepID=UPI0018D4D529|nr:hypothetical protein [Tessaracoccus coleopterorum]
MTNRFDLGQVEVSKLIGGTGAAQVPADTEFVVQLECTAVVDGETYGIELEDEGRVTLSKGTALTATYVDLPLGASCSLTEPVTGGAASSTISRRRSRLVRTRSSPCSTPSTPSRWAPTRRPVPRRARDAPSPRSSARAWRPCWPRSVASWRCVADARDPRPQGGHRHLDGVRPDGRGGGGGAGRNLVPVGTAASV